MDKTDPISCDDLRATVSFDASTGVFTWNGKPWSRLSAGTVAGCVGPQGYWRMRIRGRDYQGHRLAWLWHYGRWPVGDVDHINGNRADNRIANLREVTRSVNLQNLRKPHRKSASGLLGAHWDERRQRWESSIKVGPRRFWLGAYSSPEAAHHAYLDAKRALHVGCTI